MENPLLDPALPIPFDRIRPEHIVPAMEYWVGVARERLDAIAMSSEAPSWDNSFGALEAATLELESASTIVEHLEGCSTSPELREAYNATLPLVTAFFTGIPLNTELYRRLREFDATAEAKALSSVRRRLAKKTLDDFRRHGAELGPEDKAKLEQLDDELSRVTSKFSQNVLDATNAFESCETDASALAGLPPSALAEARESAASKGLPGYRFTLHAPSLVAVLTYAQDAGLRERIWRANDARCRQGAFDNREQLVRILALRQQKAELLGFADFAELVMVDRMARTGQAAATFVAELTEATVPAYQRELEELRAFRRDAEGADAPELMPWDIGYYAEKLRRARFDFDEEQLRPYFPVERMLEAVFTVSSELFGVRISPLEGWTTWEPSVRVYAIDDPDGTRLGVFYVDLYPRENKNGGAWMHGLVSGEPNVGLIALNASPPVPGRPALLAHRDVETLWHEFGHLLHHCLSRVELRSLAGTSVAHDFVELPSQIMENWCWERAMLDRFARHYETNQPIPTELVDKLRAARTFRAATGQMRQLGFAALDLALHRDYRPEHNGDVLDYARELQQRYTPAPLPNPYGMSTTFSHLFSRPVGYAAGYYSYKWAEVLDADAFGRFAEEGVLNPEVGRAWRNEVLAQGDAAEPMELFVAFRGRPPRPAALLERLGLVPPLSA